MCHCGYVVARLFAVNSSLLNHTILAPFHKYKGRKLKLLSIFHMSRINIHHVQMIIVIEMTQVVDDAGFQTGQMCCVAFGTYFL